MLGQFNDPLFPIDMDLSVLQPDVDALLDAIALHDEIDPPDQDFMMDTQTATFLELLYYKVDLIFV